MTDYSEEKSTRLLNSTRLILYSATILLLMFLFLVFMPMVSVLAATNESKQIRMKSMYQIQEYEQSLEKITRTKDL